MSARLEWRRIRWGILLYGADRKPTMIGALWDGRVKERAEFYEGEPARALLFMTRLQARKWCAAERAKYKSRSDFVSLWRFRPVRVVETVRTAK